MGFARGTQLLLAHPLPLRDSDPSQPREAPPGFWEEPQGPWEDEELLLRGQDKWQQEGSSKRPQVGKVVGTTEGSEPTHRPGPQASLLHGQDGMSSLPCPEDSLAVAGRGHLKGLRATKRAPWQWLCGAQAGLAIG